MPLQPGQRLGPYEIEQPLGAGGMGEVYRARDTRLDREVAVKVLPAALTESEQVRARFEREARTISQLNHSGICTLHDVGNEGGVEYLVMELIEGESLEARLERGPLPLDQALRYAIQIMNALDAAHRQRVVHRDLKPANVMITAAGAKLLDFGLAKIAAEAVEPTGASQTEIATEVKNLTEEGTILGTVQYMAPEQLEGGEADPRTDIFAFGMLLFEMITGQKAFEGKSRVSLMAAILEHPARSIAAIQPLTPPALDRLIRTCLEKNPDDRWQTAHDVELQLRWIEEGGSEVGLPAPVTRRRKGREKIAWGVAVLATIVALAFFGLWFTRPRQAARHVQTSILSAEGATYLTTSGLAVSPDGTKVVYVAYDESGTQRLYIRSLDELDARPIEGTEAAEYPFWSPDSAHVGFFVDDKLKRVTAAGAAPQTICDAHGPRGGAWNEHGEIVFSSGGGTGRGVLYRVAAGGGEPTALTTLLEEEFSHRWPSFLPGGKQLVFARQTGEGGVEGDTSTIDVLDLASGENKTILRANSSVHYADGHLFYWREGALLAHPFDVGRLQLTGDPLPLAPKVAYSNAEFASFGVSRNGVLVFHSGDAKEAQLRWYDRDGKFLETFGSPSDNIWRPRLSPDESKVVFVAETDVWVGDLERGTETRLTFESYNLSPLWSPDGEWVYFGSNRNPWGFYRKRSSGIGEAELVMSLEGDLDIFRGYGWFPDGTILGIQEREGYDFDIVRLDPEAKTIESVSATPHSERFPSLTPDGRWLLYSSDETGRAEIYVQQLDGSGGRWQVSTEGGEQPRWNPGENKIYYLSPTQELIAVPYRTEPEFRAGEPELRMAVNARSGVWGKWDITADGSRVLWVEDAVGGDAADPLTLVLDWQALLRP
ncbi:MAG: protein kinase [Gammaproteobacteria bacterium]|nr:protein kinase [Gammaproteobacteria bacterium]